MSTMSPDFASLLKKPAGEAKRPPALPAGDYPAVVSSFEYGDQNKNKTKYVRYHVRLTGWAEGVEPIEEMDLSKRQLRRDFFLTDDAFWRLDEFLRSTGLDPAGRSYEEVIPEIIGKNVTAEVQQYLNQQTNEIGNQIGKLVGQG